MPKSFSKQSRRFPHAFVCTMISVFAFAASVAPGVFLADILTETTEGTLSVSPVVPYAGCDLPPEFCVRAAQFCLPTVLQLMLIWLCAYVRFEKPLLAVLFAARGISFGMAFRLCVLLSAPPAAYIAACVHAAISVLFLFLVFHIRTDNGIRPAADSVTAMMITGGFCCAPIILTTLIL